jgi:Na+/H+ antiporter NhaC
VAFKRIVTAATAAALIFSPTVAVAARGAAPAAAAAQQVDPAAETAEGSELRRTGFIIPLAVIIAIIIGILLLTKKDKDPVST